MNRLKQYGKRFLALLLCAVIFAGALPLEAGLSQRASASWSTRYVDKMKEWGIMSGTGNGMAENRVITRAEMMAMLNRAYGFRRTGSIPFTDVPRDAWYYRDVCIAYNEGIMSGTSPTKASPNSPVNREQALLLIANAMRLEESDGEVTEFTDGRSFSPWSAPYARSALLAGIISGRPDGSFGPKSGVTRGEVACILYNALGTLINKPGDHSLGGVFGRVTINTSHVTLRDTVIAGDLYLTGGVGLGDVCLDNVRVYGKIIVAGGGEAQLGEDSIQLNNVEAQTLQIDPNARQIVSIRALGSTDIGETIVKGPAYIQDDVRDNSKGLRNISLDARRGTAFTLAGNLKDIINRTPGSTLTIGDTGTGSAKNVTVDENATDSTLNLEVNASVDKVNLDTASKITGSGDIGELTVSTNGSSSEILPDKVTVRPGVITSIGDMDNVDSEIAKEISSDPRLLQGYPAVRNVAPTTADGYFSTNKAGTVYWALTNAATGPLTDNDAESLINPSEYGSGLLLYGSIAAQASNTEYTAKLTGMETGGTYYLSAVLVDAHDRRSPVKAQKILTPDGTVPALTSGFPTFTDRTPTRTDANAELPFGEILDLQATVMANKTCDLYYVLLASGSTAPQTSEFLSASFVDPYGYGRIHMIKNTMDSFKVNEIDLNLDGVAESLGKVEENTSYDLYLWLTDADGSKSSRVTKHAVKTKDITPPKFNGDMFQTATQATSVRLANSVDENSTVYWAAVPSGDEYPKPQDGGSSTDPEFLRSEYAKMQVIYGRGATKFGKVTARENVDFSINISGLARESAYDVYYVAVDAANNCSDPIQMFTAHTLDSTPPAARQEFESVPDDSPNTPYADSTINIVFSEDIRYKQPSGSSAAPYAEPNLLKLYTNYANAKKLNPSSQETKEAEDLFTGALRDMIVPYSEANHRPLPERTAASGAGDDWGVDYRNVRVYRDGANLVVSFVNNASKPEESALNLESGARYSFQLKNIADESDNHNVMNTTTLPVFETVSAQVILGQFEGGLTLNAFVLNEDGTMSETPIQSNGDDDKPTSNIPIDISFTAEPRSTSTTADGVYWDMLFWFDTSVEFELFTREKGAVTDPWVQVGGPGKTLSITVPDNATSMRGTSLVKNLGNGEYHYINELYKPGGLHCGLNDSTDTIYEYALHFTRIGNNVTRSTFSQLVKGQVTYVTGAASTLGNQLANSLNSATAFDDVINNRNNVTEITYPKDLESPERVLSKQFSDGKAPQLKNDTPRFTPNDHGVTAVLQLDRPGTVFYVLSPVNAETGLAVSAPSDGDRKNVPVENLKYIAGSGAGVYTQDGSAEGNVVESGGKPNGKTLNTDPNEPVERYKFVYPNNLNIINPRGTGLTSPLLKTGSKDVGTADEPLEIDGLSPNTTYYFYVVTQGVSDVLSEVKVYQFTTKPITRPVITLRTSGSNVTISSNLEADVDYMIVPYSDTAMDKDIKELVQLVKPAGADDLPDPGGKMPVYEAMGKNVTSGTESAGSWFDCFDLANDSPVTKDDIADYIRTSTPNNSSIIGTGTVRVPGGGSVVVQCAKDWELTPGVNYAFLVVGRSPVGSGDAFRATYPFQMTDDQAPVIDSVNNTLHAVSDNGRWYVEGDLVLTFDEPLWYLQDGAGGQQNLSKITNAAAPLTQPPAPAAQFVSSTIMAETASTGVTVVASGDSKAPQQATSLTIRFSTTSTDKSPSGSSIVFFPGISDAGYNARMNNPLSVSVTVDSSDPNNPVVKIRIPDAWKRRGLVV